MSQGLTINHQKGLLKLDKDFPSHTVTKHVDNRGKN